MTTEKNNKPHSSAPTTATSTPCASPSHSLYGPRTIETKTKTTGFTPVSVHDHTSLPTAAMRRASPSSPSLDEMTTTATTITETEATKIDVPSALRGTVNNKSLLLPRTTATSPSSLRTTATTTANTTVTATTTAAEAQPSGGLSSTSIFANAFVPSSQRSTLDEDATLFLPATPEVPSLLPFTTTCRHLLCHFLPMVPVPDGNHHPIPVPMRFLPNSHDLHYALQHRQQLLKGSCLPEISLKSLEPNMDCESYCEAWQGILFEERRNILLRYERYTQCNTKITKIIIPYTASPRASFSMTGITGTRPSIQIGDSIVARTTRRCHKRNSEIAEAHVQCLSIHRGASGEDIIQCSWISNTPYGRLLKSMFGRNEKIRFHVRIVPRMDPLLRCLTALSWLKQLPASFFQKLFFPTKAPLLSPLEEGVDFAFSLGLNTRQMDFVRAVVQRTKQPDFESVRAPLVLTGPAGTGKTKTLLCSMRQVLAMSTNHNRIRILMCAPSHTAANDVTRRLAEFYNEKQLFRLFNADRDVAYVPVDILRFCRQQNGGGLFTLPGLNELLSFDIIVCTCHDAHFLYQAGLTNHQLRLHRMGIEQKAIQDLKSCGVVVGRIPEVHQPHFTHLFIDEAAQATEPETLIPLSVVVDPIPGGRKVEIALVGDPRQLSPQVYSANAANGGLSQSWMERLLQRPVECLGGGDEAMMGPDLSSIDALLRYSLAMDGHEQISFFVTNNYRGHPSFLCMPSALFYADKLWWASYDQEKHSELLQNEWCERLRHLEQLAPPVIPSDHGGRKQFGFPIHFRGVIGKDKSHMILSGTIREESWINEMEAQAVKQIALTLHEVGVSSAAIGVMAPFRSQVILIRKVLRGVGLGGVNVGTIRDFQGIEMEVVILSLTRSTPSFVSHDIDKRIGLFGQKKQSNVALTRAEQLQIVVGNPDVMVTDPYWRQWLWFCLRNGLWHGEEGGTRHLSEHLDSLPQVNTLQHDGEDSQNCVVVSRLEKILVGLP